MKKVTEVYVIFHMFGKEEDRLVGVTSSGNRRFTIEFSKDIAIENITGDELIKSILNTDRGIHYIGDL